MGLRKEVDKLVVLLSKQNLGGPFARELSCMVSGFKLKAQDISAHSPNDSLLGELEGTLTVVDHMVSESRPKSGDCGGPKQSEGVMEMHWRWSSSCCLRRLYVGKGDTGAISRTTTDNNLFSLSTRDWASPMQSRQISESGLDYWEGLKILGDFEMPCRGVDLHIPRQSGLISVELENK